MTLNRSLFVVDPLSSTLPNDGVAKVVEPTSPEQWDVLRYELQSFVCEGEYHQGLERILSTYLTNVGRQGQPAVWVSGFYGSGKSHLVRMLEFLWRDVEFPDGATARGLVNLPDDIRALLRELDTQGRQSGGLWSAAGTLSAGSGDNPRAAILGLVFKSAGLPERIAPARLVLWLRQNGYLEAVMAGLEASGRSISSELNNMYVSPVLVAEIRKAYPDFAPDDRAGRELIKAQYPRQDDVSTEEMVDLIREVLELKSARHDRLPCTLLVLDEVQQYLGDSSERTHQLQEAVEACTHRLGSQILFVATGQSALQGTVQLQKLQGRFTVHVTLSDTDVERVVRQVVLRKKSAMEAELERVLDGCSGEISRHLVGSRIGAVAADTAVLVADYPILPVRRRFWEDVLRAVDKAGAAGQLRTQLRMVHEASKAVGEEPVGTVVGADLLYQQQSPAMLQSGVLPNELNVRIQREKDGTADGDLRHRICATVFLINQLHQETGVLATSDTLADLLVEDLPKGSADLRRRIPDLLKSLVESGLLLQVGDEYRIQTREGAEWEKDYRGRRAHNLADDARIASDRTTLLKSAFTEALKGATLTQGASKVARKIEPHFSAEPPTLSGSGIPVWVRDEWGASQKTVRDDALTAGLDSAMVYAFLPKRSADPLREHLAGCAAAEEVLKTRPQPTTPEGLTARKGMETRQEGHQLALKGLVEEILRDAQVLLGGGSEVSRDTLREKVLEASEKALSRLFPEFSKGDHPKWDTVITQSKQGRGGDLTPVEYKGDPDTHPVCKEILKYVGSGKKGLEVRRQFTDPPYGWPNDTVDGALMALLACNAVRATLNGSAVTATGLERTKLGQTEFRTESRPPTTEERLWVRKLLLDAGYKCNSGDEPVVLPTYLRRLKELAKEAGGAPPLPAPPDTSHIEDLLSKNGNDLVVTACDRRETLDKNWKEWSSRAKQVIDRSDEWNTLSGLLSRAQSLPVACEVAPEVEAIIVQRSLLNDPDPTVPLRTKLEDALRQALVAAREAHLSAYDEKIEDLLSNPDWRKLPSQDQESIRQQYGLVALDPLDVGTVNQLLNTLSKAPLEEWGNRTAALSERIAQALHTATQKLEPKTERVTLPHATLKTEEDVENYVQRIRYTLLQHIENGKPVVV